MQTNGSRTVPSLIPERGVLLGCCIDSASPAIAELAGILGFDFVWADLKHLSVDRTQAENFCRGAKAGGALSLLRAPGAERDHILHALEAGANLVVVPMVESPETAVAIVRHGKYAPLGMRGFNGSPRGMQYGVGQRADASFRTDRNGCGRRAVRGNRGRPGDQSRSRGTSGPVCVHGETTGIRRPRSARGISKCDSHNSRLPQPGRCRHASSFVVAGRARGRSGDRDLCIGNNHLAYVLAADTQAGDG